MFMLIIWLQGIWLPRHGYTFAVTPLWAGISMIPLTAGFLIGGPLSGILSDRYGSRPFATGGMLGSAVAFFLLEQVPVDFSYRAFGVLLFFMGLVMASFRRLEPHRRDEQPAGIRPRRRVGHEHDLPELGPGALHRHLLHLIIVGLSDHLPAALVSRPERPRGPARPRRSRSRTCLRSRRSSPRSSATTRPPTSSAPTCCPS